MSLTRRLGRLPGQTRAAHALQRLLVIGAQTQRSLLPSLGFALLLGHGLLQVLQAALGGSALRAHADATAFDLAEGRAHVGLVVLDVVEN